jgi:hypothetical protein
MTKAVAAFRSVVIEGSGCTAIFDENSHWNVVCFLDFTG